MFSYGDKFKITIYGTSHEKTMGLIIEGLKPGTTIDTLSIKEALDKRRPGSVGTTKRVEADEFVIENGYFNNKTTGAPLHIIVNNNNVKSEDYGNLNTHFRPNHADYAANVKYQGHQDYRGGGFFSGRLTTLLVIAGSIAKSQMDYKISSNLIQVGDLKNLSQIDSYLEKVSNNKDSVGGVVELRVSNVKAGLGDPYFNKLDAKIAHMMLTIPGVRGLIFGEDFDVEKPGSYNNDLINSLDGKTLTNHSGGIVGGISNGNDIVFNCLVKPTSSIGVKQETYNFGSKQLEDLEIVGRHDAAFVRRIPIVLESALAIVLANF